MTRDYANSAPERHTALRLNLPSRASREARMCAIDAASRLVAANASEGTSISSLLVDVKRVTRELEDLIWAPIQGRGDRND